MTACWVFIDSCAVNRFALLNLDPVRALAGSAFTVAMTASLQAEYRRGLNHRFVEPHIKKLLARLLDKAVCVDADRSEDGDATLKGTDFDLVALSERAIVITVDQRSPWHRAQNYAGLVLWGEVESAIRAGGTLLDVLRPRAERLSGG